MTRPLPTLDAASIQHILEERARALARSTSDDLSVKTVPLVVLAIGAERFGISLHQVQEVQPLRGLTPVPGVAACWAGVVNLRGRLYPVLDLGRYLGLPAAGSAAGLLDGQIVVVSAAGLNVAIWTSDVLGVRQVPPDDIQPSLLADDAPRRIVTGITADLLSVLDLDVLLSDPALVVQEEVA